MGILSDKSRLYVSSGSKALDEIIGDPLSDMDDKYEW